MAKKIKCELDEKTWAVVGSKGVLVSGATHDEAVRYVEAMASSDDHFLTIVAGEAADRLSAAQLRRMIL